MRIYGFSSVTLGISAGFSSRTWNPGDSRLGTFADQMETVSLVFIMGLPQAWNMTCADTLATGYFAQATIKARNAAEKLEKRKNLMHKDIFCNFYSTPLEALFHGVESQSLKNDCLLGKRIAVQTGENPFESFFSPTSKSCFATWKCRVCFVQFADFSCL